MAVQLDDVIRGPACRAAAATADELHGDSKSFRASDLWAPACSAGWAAAHVPALRLTAEARSQEAHLPSLPGD